MGVFDGISKITIVCAAVTGLAFLLHIIGYASAYWIKTDYHNEGLWYACATINTQTLSATVCGKINAVDDWFRAVQAFETLGFLALLAACVVIVLKLFVMKEQKILVIVRLLLLFGAAGCILLGIIIYGAEIPSTDYGFAFVLCIIAALISLAAGGVTFFELRGGINTPS